EVKRTRANDSVRSPHVKVGHRQGFILKSGSLAAFFLCIINVKNGTYTQPGRESDFAKIVK
ncbi:hypothetical protein, partial [Fluoribacter dumoffii]|uniref:hypothetical protein n=1 Tax=Fluoribacter dumoffii TaxID=463 RepID=UPI00073C879C